MHAPGSLRSAYQLAVPSIGGFLILTLSTLVLLCEQAAFAQAYSPFEIGALSTTVRFIDAVNSRDQKSGFGLRLTYNLSPILAFDAEGDFFPGMSPVDSQRGGRAFTVLAGAKAGWRWHRMGLFISARPGLTNFSDIDRIETGVCNGIPCFTVFPGGHINHFVLNLDAAVEINTTSRTFLSFDVGEMLVRYRDRNYLFPTALGVSVGAPGVIGNSLLVSAGINYRLGSLAKIADRPISIEDARRWEVGVHYEILSMGRADVVDDPAFVPVAIGDDKGLGGRLTYDFKRWLGIDGILNYFYTDRNISDAQRGGKILQGEFGPKAGVRANHYGVFAKLEPGFLSYGAVHDNYFPPFPTTRLTHFAVNFGAVLEYYPSRHTMMRFDLGHTVGFYGAQTVAAPAGPPFHGSFRDPGFRDSGMEFMTGVGWRF